MSEPRVLFRTDASRKIGTGHVLRCISLAQALAKQGVKSTFLSSDQMSNILQEKLADYDLQIKTESQLTAELTAEIAQQQNASWVVVDGYQFSLDYISRIKDSGLKVLWIDDFGTKQPANVDLILNQNSYALPSQYSGFPTAEKLLLSSSNVLLRNDFLSWKTWTRVLKPIPENLLITLGGSDPENTGEKILNALEQSNQIHLNIKMIVGPNNPNFQKLQSLAKKTEILTNVQNMPEWMAWADLAISAGGTTCWELSFMGLPSLVVAIADNQIALVDDLDKRRVAKNLGWHTDLTDQKLLKELSCLMADFPTRSEMSMNGRALVDGLGSERIVRAMGFFQD